MKLNNIIIGLNDNIKYISLLPLVYLGWKKFFPEAKMIIAYVGNKDDSIVPSIRLFCDELEFYPIIKNINSINLSKIVRYYSCCKKSNDEFCMINDADIIPLQREYYYNLMQQMKRDKLNLIGYDNYTKEREKGKSPAGYMSGYSSIFNFVYCNGENLSWEGFMNKLLNIKNVIDNKEYITNEPKNFCDESLTRYLLKQNKIDLSYNLKRGFNVETESIYTYNKTNNDNLMNGKLIEAHHLIKTDISEIDKIIDEKLNNINLYLHDYIDLNKI